jgi:hypothetical protein
VAQAKLTDELVIDLRRRRAAGALLRELVESLPVRVSLRTVWLATTGRTWSHLPMGTGR